MDRESVDELKRHFGVVAEELRSEVRAVAEGQEGLKDSVDALRAEVGREFEDTRALIRLSHAKLYEISRPRLPNSSGWGTSSNGAQPWMTFLGDAPGPGASLKRRGRDL